jgi:hypothetical protein
MDFPRDTGSIRYNGGDNIHTVPSAVVRYCSATSLRLALPLVIGSYDSSVRGVEENAGTQALIEHEEKPEAIGRARRKYFEEKAAKYNLQPVALGLFGGVWDYNRCHGGPERLWRQLSWN